jgi:hypothetical protein
MLYTSQLVSMSFTRYADVELSTMYPALPYCCSHTPVLSLLSESPLLLFTPAVNILGTLWLVSQINQLALTFELRTSHLILQIADSSRIHSHWRLHFHCLFFNNALNSPKSYSRSDWQNDWLTDWLADWLAGWLSGWLTDANWLYIYNF